ncbi:FAD/NAD(P)-binding protein [Telmatospirillum sp.]|uniref:FAD/NAD(P)-binding protein n=1 Tax=Telmatospirillum sp. TaxID=2079197 RepID=UPI00284B9CCE|nr:FAD/NAD(P)-binding protein [Telmatospirillum sp.]MDR3436857.1 FAD/NAD(P)-binding protein [Telmatospirillum sp.]
MKRHGPVFGIIGGGLSGSLLAVHLLRSLPDGGRVHLVEKRSGFGLGQAYSTRNPQHLLNVPAERMSAFEDDPDHFLNWLRDGKSGEPADRFVPRGVYGDYIQGILGQQIRDDEGCRNLFLFPDEAVGLTVGPAGVVIQTAGGRPVEVDRVILAIGNFPPEAPFDVGRLASSPRYLSDPWDAERVAAIPPDSPVLLVGSGLTMVDLALGLIRQGHRAPITALSRRGLLPHRHAPAAAPLPWDGAEPPVALSVLLHQIRLRSALGGDWRSVVDGLRPHLQDWWQAMSDDDKRRFLRHARPWWDIHRHRMAPRAAERLEHLITDGYLRVLAGQLLEATVGTDGVSVVCRPRGGAEHRQLEVGHIVNCSGPCSDFAKIRHPLLARLIGDGLARPDSMRLGLDVDPLMRLLDGNGHPQERLFALGPVTRGRFWESTAVPEIRRQAKCLADYLTEDVPS